MNIRLIAATYLLTLICAFQLPANAQQSNTKYYSADDFFLYGKAKPTANRYQRIDTSEYNDLPASIRQLLTNSLDLTIAFKTTRSSISVK
jgi:hypothetical protein